MKEIDLKYHRASEDNAYYSIKSMTQDELIDLLITHNINIGPYVITLYNIRLLQKLITKSRFKTGWDIIYVRDLIKDVGHEGFV